MDKYLSLMVPFAHAEGFGEGFSGHGMMQWGHGFWWMMPLMFIGFWLTVIVCVVFFVRWLSASSKANEGGGAKGQSAVEILKLRYVRGEIEKEEYEAKKKDIEG